MLPVEEVYLHPGLVGLQRNIMMLPGIKYCSLGPERTATTTYQAY